VMSPHCASANHGVRGAGSAESGSRSWFGPKKLAKDHRTVVRIGPLRLENRQEGIVPPANTVPAHSFAPEP